VDICRYIEVIANLHLSPFTCSLAFCSPVFLTCDNVIIDFFNPVTKCNMSIYEKKILVNVFISVDIILLWVLIFLN
jgi:hypothetical protein